jgi:transketolase
LAGFAISIEDLKQFRQFGSKTPSHPDITKTEGIEATTGVDGQGVGFAVGQALALKLSHLTSKVIVLAGDGCLMEGISYESCSIAGHLNLNNLILIYDSNQTTLDGYVEESFSEEVKLRFQAQGWDVFEIDGHDFAQIREVFIPLREQQNKPVIVIAHTKIGYGAPTKEGTPAAHGRPLGAEEIEKAKASLNIMSEAFDVDPDIYAFFLKKSSSGYQTTLSEKARADFKLAIEQLSIRIPIPTRWASHEILNALAEYIPALIVGSADLSSSDGTFLRNYHFISKNQFQGRNIKYGVREFAMAGIAAGMAQTGLIIPVIGTFLAFADYMRSAIRMTSLMHLQVIYHLTHDSIFVGHDGPTHQPIEQLSSLRGIPGLLVLRPADSYEVKAAWIAALEYSGPTAMILSRQPLPELNYDKTLEDVLKGAYIIKRENSSTVKYLLLATGSEVQLALEVAEELGPATRVVSMPSWELFEKQTDEYKKSILRGELKVSIEAGIEQGWHKYIGSEGISIALSSFGECGSIEDLKTHFGYTKEKIVNKIMKAANKL